MTLYVCVCVRGSGCMCLPTCLRVCVRACLCVRVGVFYWYVLPNPGNFGRLRRTRGDPTGSPRKQLEPAMLLVIFSFSFHVVKFMCSVPFSFSAFLLWRQVEWWNAGSSTQVPASANAFLQCLVVGVPEDQGSDAGVQEGRGSSCVLYYLNWPLCGLNIMNIIFRSFQDRLFDWYVIDSCLAFWLFIFRCLSIFKYIV